MKKTITLALFGLITCFCYGQQYFEVETEYNCKCGSFTKKLAELKKYSPAEIQGEFDLITYKSGLQFNYPQGGCQQRAEMMHIILNKDKIEHARIWLFAPVDLTEGSSVYLEIKDKNGLAPDSTITWGYHVAPCVLVVSGGKTDTLIVDPALDKKAPMTLAKWLKAINNSDQSKYTFLQPQYYFFNTQKNGASPVINGFFYTYDPVPGITTKYDDATVERELAVNDVAVYLKQKLDSGYPDTGKEIKQLLGNVNNMVSFFAPQQRFNSLNGVTMRQLLINHKKLITAAIQFYQQRVNYWTEKVTALK